jgi:hypothetical protein
MFAIFPYIICGVKIYLDTCCLNRPFDDQSQERVRLESEAVLLILARVQEGTWDWLSSDVVNDEIDQIPDPERRERTHSLVFHADRTLSLTDKGIERAKELVKLGFGGMDALHLACAESEQVDIFLTTDDKLQRRATRLTNQLQVSVSNPLNWLLAQEVSN